MQSESEYRNRIHELYKVIENAFENIDPDIAECENTLGAMTLVFADQTRCILSAQPSVRQLWLALASRGTAYHFNYDESSRKWMDDKGRGDLNSILEEFFFEMTGIKIGVNQP